MKKSNLNTAIILCGGKSKRMGFDKQTITIDGQLIGLYIGKLLEAVFDEIILITNKQNLYKGCDYLVTRDQVVNFGPLAGIHAGLDVCKSSHAYVIAGDMPFVDLNYIRHMKSFLSGRGDLDVLVTKDAEGHIEPFNGFYGKGLVPIIEQAFLDGTHKIIEIFNQEKTAYINYGEAAFFSPDWSMFSNLNTPEDYEKEKLIGKEIGIYENNFSSGLLKFG